MSEFQKYTNKIDGLVNLYRQMFVQTYGAPLNYHPKISQLATFQMPDTEINDNFNKIVNILYPYTLLDPQKHKVIISKSVPDISFYNRTYALNTDTIDGLNKYGIHQDDLFTIITLVLNDMSYDSKNPIKKYTRLMSAYENAVLLETQRGTIAEITAAISKYKAPRAAFKNYRQINQMFSDNAKQLLKTNRQSYTDNEAKILKSIK